jgi:hypothetical protein
MIYLGFTPRTLAAIVAAFVTLTAVAAVTFAVTDYGAPCIGDDGAPCLTAVEVAELHERVAALRADRSGNRFDEGSR